MICNNCKTNLQGEFKFCPNCGASTNSKAFCQGCGKETEGNWAVCPYCGQKLTAAAMQSPHQENIVHEPKHGYYHGRSSSRHLFGSHSGRHHRRRGFLGNLFSS